MRLGFRTRWLTFVLYLREMWSLELWVGKLGFCRPGTGQPFRVGWGKLEW